MCLGYMVTMLAELPQTPGGAAAPDQHRRLAANLSLLLVTAIWGTTFVIVKDAIQVVPPLTFIALRFTLGAAALVLLLRGRLRSLRRQEALAGMLIGAFLFAGFAFQTFGLRLTSASTAAFITGLSVVLVPLAAYLWLGQRPSLSAVLGVLSAGAGLALLSLREDFGIGAGDLLVLLCAIAFALHIVAVGKFAPRLDALTLAFVQVACVAAAGWAAAVTIERPTFVLTPQLTGTLLFIGIVATALVFAIQNVAQRFTSPTHTALIFTMEPVFAAFFAYLWLGELLSSRALVGAGLILVGMVVAELHRSR